MLPAVPCGKVEAMRALPTRWQWDSLSEAAHPWHRRGELSEVPSARGVSWCPQYAMDMGHRVPVYVFVQ